MTKGIYIHTKSGVEYDLLYDRITHKSTKKKLCLLRMIQKPTVWYVETVQNFQKNFILKQ